MTIKQKFKKFTVQWQTDKENNSYKTMCYICRRYNTGSWKMTPHIYTESPGKGHVGEVLAELSDEDGGMLNKKWDIQAWSSREMSKLK